MSTVWLLPNGGSQVVGIPTQGIIIGGKKLVDANTAYRGKLRIGFGSAKTTDIAQAIPQATPLPSPTTTVENVSKVGFMGINIGAGLEKRVGSSRVVGVYGGELNVGFGSGKTTNEWGNAMTAAVFNSPQDSLSGSGPLGRVTESKIGSSFSVGVNAFAGVEWFCAPKISLSGEYTWGLALSSVGTTETTSERWDPTLGNGVGGIVTTTTEGDPQANAGGDKTNNFRLDTGVSGLSIGVNFYFQ